MLPALLIVLAGCPGEDAATTPTGLDSPPEDSAVSPTGDSATEHLGGVDPGTVLINELLPVSDSTDPWVELYNPGEAAVSLAGWHMSNNWSWQTLFTFDVGVSIEAGGHLLLWASGVSAEGWDHLNFQLDQDGGAVGLFTPDGEPADWQLFPGLGDDHAWARLPDGADTWQEVALGTPGAPNQDLVAETSTPLPAGSEWAYHDQGLDLGTAWREPEHDDSAWPRGPGPLGYGDSQVTTLSYGVDSSDKRPTAYFRTTFAVDDPAVVGALELGVNRDDGAAVYLNGVEVVRTALPEGELSYDTLASSTAGSSDETTYFSFAVDPSHLVAGENVLAAEVHQASPTSSDLTWDATVEVVVVRER